jgi:hypothetical protein
MDTDAEYKLYSWMADRIERAGNNQRGKLYLYTELAQCESCLGLQAQFEAKFGRRVKVVVLHGYPYPFPKR